MKNWLLNVQNGVVVDTPTSEFVGHDAYVDIPDPPVILPVLIGVAIGVAVTLLAVWLFKKR